MSAKKSVSENEIHAEAACCCRTKVRTEKEHRDLINRLSRIEGQIRGIRRMVEMLTASTSSTRWRRPMRR